MHCEITVGWTRLLIDRSTAWFHSSPFQTWFHLLCPSSALDHDDLPLLPLHGRLLFNSFFWLSLVLYALPFSCRCWLVFVHKGRFVIRLLPVPERRHLLSPRCFRFVAADGLSHHDSRRKSENPIPTAAFKKYVRERASVGKIQKPTK